MNTEKNKKIWLKKCEENLRMRGRSEITITRYKFAWIRFLNHYSENTNISKFTIDDLIKYFKKEFLDRNLSASSYNQNLSAVRFFYIICFNKNFSRVLLPNSIVRKRYPSIISKEQFITIVNNENVLEHKCWLLLAFCSGLRICEIAILKIEDIDSKNHKLKVLGKGNKERFTILSDIVIYVLRLYYKSKGFTHKNGYLFFGNTYKDHINSRSIGNYFCRLKKEYNLPKDITEHSLRHSFATYYLMNDGDLVTLQQMLGHKSLATTSIYLHLAHDFNNLKGIKYDKK